MRFGNYLNQRKSKKNRWIEWKISRDFQKRKKKQEETKFTTVYWLKQSAAKDVWLPNVKDLNVQLNMQYLTKYVTK